MLPTGWQPCASEAIEAFRYDPASGVLQIAYVNGRKVYDFPCDQALFAQFRAAPSKGTFVQQVLRSHARALGWSRPSYAWPW